MLQSEKYGLQFPIVGEPWRVDPLPPVKCGPGMTRETPLVGGGKAVETWVEKDGCYERTVHVLANSDGSETMLRGDCSIQLGGSDGDGYCYTHQTFDCMDPEGD